MIDFVKVGMKITKYRKEQNLTQDDLAEALFVSRQLVSKWENGTGVPSIDVLLDLCKMFHVTFEEILCLNDEIDINPDDIFHGHERLFVINEIINGNLVVDIPSVFYQLSPVERMMILREIKDRKIKCDLTELIPKLTIGEQNYLRKDINRYDFKESNDR